MSTIEVEGYDYTEMTRSYMNVFHSQKFNQFLNTSQSGLAHSSSGIGPMVLMKTLFTSICLCTFQLVLFCLFRSTFKFLYQPRCYYVPLNERMKPLPKGFFNWIIPIFRYNINYYLSMGLDAYFFVRYINILLLFFVFIGSLNMMILIPINWTGSSDGYSASGLDKLSLSNISSSKVRRLNGHFIMSLITIGFFNWLVYYEFQSFVKIRQSYLLSEMHSRSIISKTLLLTDIPSHLKDLEPLTKIFDDLPGGVKNIWFLYDNTQISTDVEEAGEIFELLEESQIEYLKRYLKKYGNNGDIQVSGGNDDVNVSIPKSNSYKEDTSLSTYFYPPIYQKTLYIPVIERSLRIKFPGFFRIFLLQKKVLQYEWCIRELQKRLESIQRQKVLLVEGKVKKINKAFIEFNTQTGANIAHQCLLSQVHGSFDRSFIEVHPNDILWGNIAKQNPVSCSIEKYIITLLFVAIIVLYVVPVSLIGLLSRLPLLIEYMPFLSWILTFPEKIQKVIASVLPSLLLSILTEVVVITFRYFAYFTGALTGCEVELSLQRWYFAFLFIQQFLVVTISSSLTVIFKHIVDQPTSIPILLAINLPKAAIFFFQYLALKAFAFCGNNFLRIDKLVSHYLFCSLFDKTPRQKFRRLTTLLKINWGTTYPVYAVYASIGFAYSIISPMISIFIIFMLVLVLLYYKYALKYIYSHINVSETQGKLYPVAILHLYPGVYCLEFCLMGIFVLSKDNHGNYPMKIHGFLMLVVILITIFVHLTVYNKFYKHSTCLPILNDKNIISNADDNSNMNQRNESEKYPYNSPNEYYSNQNLLYLHPAFKYEPPKLWLPDDHLGISKAQIQFIEANTSLKGGNTNGTSIQIGKRNKFFKIMVTKAPPDYK